MEPDQTARPIGAVSSGSTLFASIVNLSVMQLFAADNFSRRHFQLHFFLALLGLNMFSSETDDQK